MFNNLKQRCQQSSKNLLHGQPYRFIDNGAKVLGVAHCDSVRAGYFKFRQRGHHVYSTALDDRLGVNILLDVLPALGIVCDVLLTDDEEIGRSTAQLFEPPKDYNWIFQFDRRGTDAVVYDYDGMRPYAAEHFRLGYGSFSDICYLEHLGCGGLNIGTGYYHEHTPQSFANLKQTAWQVGRFSDFYGQNVDQFIPGCTRGRSNFVDLYDVPQPQDFTGHDDLVTGLGDWEGSRSLREDWDEAWDAYLWTEKDRQRVDWAI